MCCHVVRVGAGSMAGPPGVSSESTCTQVSYNMGPGYVLCVRMYVRTCVHAMYMWRREGNL